MKSNVTRPKQTLYGFGDECLTGWIVYLKNRFVPQEYPGQESRYKNVPFAIFQTKQEARLFALKAATVTGRYEFAALQGKPYWEA